jgi:hypothetical protein
LERCRGPSDRFRAGGYYEAKDTPRDEAGQSEQDMPADLKRELAELGLL